MKIKNVATADIDYIRKNIKLIRESKNLAQREVAQALGIITNTYQKFENGDIVLNMIRLHQIAEVFGMSVADIINYPNIVVAGAGADSERVKELEEMYLEKLQKVEKMQAINIQLVLAFYQMRDFFIKSQNEGKDINESYSFALKMVSKYIELFKVFLGAEEINE